jgi:hypothetical protein
MRIRDLLAFVERSLLAGLLVATGCGKDGPKEVEADASADAAAAGISPTSCLEAKSPQAFVTTVTQDLYGRQPTATELEQALSDFDSAAFVDAALASSSADDGLTRCTSNLFRLANLRPEDEDDAGEAALLADLKQEPVVLVLRNKDKLWSHVFETTDVYCTERTARLSGGTRRDERSERSRLSAGRSPWRGARSPPSHRS